MFPCPRVLPCFGAPRAIRALEDTALDRRRGVKVGSRNQRQRKHCLGGGRLERRHPMRADQGPGEELRRPTAPGRNLVRGMHFCANDRYRARNPGCWMSPMGRQHQFADHGSGRWLLQEFDGAAYPQNCGWPTAFCVDRIVSPNWYFARQVSAIADIGRPEANDSSQSQADAGSRWAGWHRKLSAACKPRTLAAQRLTRPLSASAAPPNEVTRGAE